MLDQNIDLSPLRTKFPALQQIDESGSPYIYFDGPGGTQVPQTVMDAMADYFINANANCGGPFITSYRNDELIKQARIAMADLLNAGSENEIVFGANMTTLTFNLSRAIGRNLQPGDEIIVTRLTDINGAYFAALTDRNFCRLSQVSGKAHFHAHQVSSPPRKNHHWRVCTAQTSGDLHHGAVTTVYRHNIYTRVTRLNGESGGVTTFQGDGHIPFQSGGMKYPIQSV